MFFLVSFHPAYQDSDFFFSLFNMPPNSKHQEDKDLIAHESKFYPDFKAEHAKPTKPSQQFKPILNILFTAIALLLLTTTFNDPSPFPYDNYVQHINSFLPSLNKLLSFLPYIPVIVHFRNYCQTRYRSTW